jgi:hypothetical protein
MHAVDEQYVERRPAGLWTERGPIRLRQRLMRHGQHRAVEIGKDNAPRFVDNDCHAERFIEPENRAGLGRPRRIVLARDRDDWRVRQAAAQAVQLAEEEEDRGVGGTNGVEDVARDSDEIGFLLEEIVDGPAERFRNVGLALIRPPRRLAIELPETQMQVGEVSELQ